jgi:hypothetical protein
MSMWKLFLVRDADGGGGRVWALLGVDRWHEWEAVAPSPICRGREGKEGDFF